jgi:hypothetical protein
MSGANVSGADFEGDVGGVVEERLAQRAAAHDRPFFRRIEDFAVDNMRSISIGASAALVLLAGSLLFNEAPAVPAPAQGVDVTSTGSVHGQLRVPQAPDWQAVRKPTEIISLQAPHLERMVASYGARRSSRNDREDTLHWQTQAPGGPEARIALHRGAEGAAAPSLFVDMTRQQAERGIAITRSGTPGLVMTKFGPVEMADMTFSDAGGGAQACLAFRRVGEAGEPNISGWQCAAQGAVVERPELACFIDRLALLKGGEDQGLRRFFAEAETRRRPCPTSRNTAGRKPTWLDQDGRPPAMRGAEETTGSIARPKR